MKWARMGDLGSEGSEHENGKFWPLEEEIDAHGKQLHRQVNMIDVALIFGMDSH